MKALTGPLLVLGALAAWLGGWGVADTWQSHAGQPAVAPLPYIVSAALHAAWMLAVGRRRASLVAVIHWPVTCWLCCRGLAEAGFGAPFLYALTVEGAPLALALALTERGTWSDRLARWRRARNALAVQWEMWSGRGHERFLAALADAECRLKVRLAGMAIPEQLRQAVLTSAGALLADAEVAGARTAVELERKALTEAASCRDLCERLEDLPPERRNALARQCETLFVHLLEPEKHNG